MLLAMLTGLVRLRARSSPSTGRSAFWSFSRPTAKPVLVVKALGTGKVDPDVKRRLFGIFAMKPTGTERVEYYRVDFQAP